MTRFPPLDTKQKKCSLP